MAEKIDLDTIMDELSTRLEDMIEDVLVEQIDSAVQNTFSETFGESLLDFEFLLKDGTIVRPKQRMKLFSPDKTKLVLCYGGLRVDDFSLMVQTRISSWENIANYTSKEEAIEALIKVKNAMEANLPIFEL